MNVMLTGASGFLGSKLSSELSYTSDIKLTAIVRPGRSTAGGRVVEIADIDADTDWFAALQGQNVVIHAAARAHVMNDEAQDPLQVFRKVNVDGTLNLARQAAAAGVKRFIFISSIKVNGEQTPVGKVFTADDMPAPEDAYGISKWEAEQGLQKLSNATDMEVVIIRPPLVYGTGVKGNLASVIKLIEKGFPLPLGAINNKRSLVAVDNLTNLIIVCIGHPAAANQIFLAGDGKDLSTTELVRGLSKAMNKPVRLVSVPLLKLVVTLLGKKQVAKRLLGSLQVDISKAQNILGWEPPISVEEGLRRCFTQPSDKDVT